MTKRKMKTSEIKAELGVDERTLLRWRRAGCPSTPAGRGVVYDLDAVRAWMAQVGRTGDAGGPPEERGPASGAPAPLPAPVLSVAVQDEDDDDQPREDDPPTTAELRDQLLAARVRKEVAMADRYQLDLATKRREVAPISEFLSVFLGQIAMVKEAFESMPGRLSARLAQQDYETIYATLDDELRRLLFAFAESPMEGVDAQGALDKNGQEESRRDSK